MVNYELPLACIPFIGCKWKIWYYSENSLYHIVEGINEEEWNNAPINGVQVISIFTQIESQKFAHAPKDRILITGYDEYNPFGWGIKYGQLISDEEYQMIWSKAIGND